MCEDNGFDSVSFCTGFCWLFVDVECIVFDCKMFGPDVDGASNNTFDGIGVTYFVWCVPFCVIENLVLCGFCHCSFFVNNSEGVTTFCSLL
jgi:hypothetical protein